MPHDALQALAVQLPKGGGSRHCQLGSERTPLLWQGSGDGISLSTCWGSAEAVVATRARTELVGACRCVVWPRLASVAVEARGDGGRLPLIGDALARQLARWLLRLGIGRHQTSPAAALARRPQPHRASAGPTGAHPRDGNRPKGRDPAGRPHWRPADGTRPLGRSVTGAQQSPPGVRHLPTRATY